MKYVDDAYAAAQDADALLILSDWQEFAELEVRLRERLTPFCLIHGQDRSAERVFRAYEATLHRRHSRSLERKVAAMLRQRAYIAGRAGGRIERGALHVLGQHELRHGLEHRHLDPLADADRPPSHES